MEYASTQYDFNLRSTSVADGQIMPDAFVGFGCMGQNLSPELEWSGAPSDTKSFAITCFDPDARTGHGRWHWTIVNIPSNVNKLEEGASNTNNLPLGAKEIMTGLNESGYGGPCPPRGEKAHRYIFTAYALDTANLTVDPKSNAEDIKEVLEKRALAKSSFTVKYQRQ